MNRYTVDVCGMGPEGITGRRYVTASGPRHAAMGAGGRLLSPGSAVLAGAEVFHDARGTIYVVRVLPAAPKAAP